MQKIKYYNWNTLLEKFSKAPTTLDVFCVLAVLIFKASLTHGMCYLGVIQALYEQYFDSSEKTHISVNVTLQKYNCVIADGNKRT